MYVIVQKGLLIGPPHNDCLLFGDILLRYVYRKKGLI